MSTSRVPNSAEAIPGIPGTKFDKIGTFWSKTIVYGGGFENVDRVFTQICQNPYLQPRGQFPNPRNRPIPKFGVPLLVFSYFCQARVVEALIYSLTQNLVILDLQIHIYYCTSTISIFYENSVFDEKPT